MNLSRKQCTTEKTEDELVRNSIEQKIDREEFRYIFGRPNKSADLSYLKPHLMHISIIIAEIEESEFEIWSAKKYDP